MKKFLKKRPSNVVVQQQTLPEITVERVSSSSPNTVDQLAHRIEMLSSENVRLRTAMQRLSDENISLQDRVRDRSAPPVDGETLAIGDRMSEVQKLVQLITEENDRLTKQLTMEREHLRHVQLAQDDHVHRLTADCQRWQVESSRLQQELQLAIMENDEWRLRVAVLTQQRGDAAQIEEYQNSFETCRGLLEELKQKYREELARLQKALSEAMTEKRTLSLRLSQCQADASVAEERRRLLEKTAGVLENDIQRLSMILSSRNERLSNVESLFRELLDVVACLARDKTSSGDNPTSAEDRRILTKKLGQLADRCRRLRDDNERLRRFKDDAIFKLRQAKELLVSDSINQDGERVSHV